MSLKSNLSFPFPLSSPYFQSSLSTGIVLIATGLLPASFSYTLRPWFNHLFHLWWFYNAVGEKPTLPRNSRCGSTHGCIKNLDQDAPLTPSPLCTTTSLHQSLTLCSSHTELFWVPNLVYFFWFFFPLLLSLVNSPIPLIISTKITSFMNSFLTNKKEQITASFVPCSLLLFITCCCKAPHILSSS